LTAYFWSNNDRDVEHVVDSNDHEKDDIPPDYNDYSEPGLTCTRDLEDLTRIRLDLSKFLHEFGSVDNDINLRALRIIAIH